MCWRTPCRRRPCPPVNDALVTQAYASRQFITDVTEYTPYYRDILTLYRTGVSIGSDDTGSYPAGPAHHPGRGRRHAHPHGGSLACGLTPDWDLDRRLERRRAPPWPTLVPAGDLYRRSLHG